MAAAGVVTGLLVSTTAASAAFTDTATLATGSVGAHQIVSHGPPACETYGGILGLLTGARITWAHADERYEYAWIARRTDNGVVVASGVVSPAAAAGSTVTLEMNTNLLDLGLGSRALGIVVTARLKGAPAWAASTSSTTPVTTTAVLLGLNVRCA